MTSKTASVELTKKFIKGLQNYNLSYEDIKKNNWTYCGGDRGRHLEYYKLFFKHDDTPDHTGTCVCGHGIEENCYITDRKEILILGNCCIKKFMPKGKSGRTCEDCGEPHRNIKINKCNDCKIGICYDCGKSCDERYNRCYNCYFY
jgi:hypothetical protein